MGQLIMTKLRCVYTLLSAQQWIESIFLKMIYDTDACTRVYAVRMQMK